VRDLISDPPRIRKINASLVRSIQPLLRRVYRCPSFCPSVFTLGRNGGHRFELFSSSTIKLRFSFSSLFLFLISSLTYSLTFLTFSYTLSPSLLSLSRFRFRLHPHLFTTSNSFKMAGGSAAPGGFTTTSNLSRKQFLFAFSLVTSLYVLFSYFSEAKSSEANFASSRRTASSFGVSHTVSSMSSTRRFKPPSASRISNLP